MNEKKLFVIMLCVITLILLPIGIICYKSDPYRPANFNGKILKIERRRYNASLGKNLDYNAVILGSSLSANTSCSVVDKYFNVKSMNFSNSGTCVDEIFFFANYFDSHKKITKTIIDFSPIIIAKKRLLKFDTSYYTNEISLTNLYNFPILKQFLRNYITKQKIESISRDDYTQWYKILPCNINTMANGYNKHLIEKIDFTERKRFFDYNMDNYIIPYINKDSKREILLFFPPVSILYYNKETIDDYILLKKYMAEKMLLFKNVKLYDFQTIPEILRFDNYKDAMHYSEKINNWMIKEMSKGNYKVNYSNIKSNNRILQKIVKEYDYEKAYLKLDEIRQSGKNN